MAEKDGGQANTRWWESYLVRYFLGFIIGAICVAVIASQSKLIPGGTELLNKTASSADDQSKYGVTAIVIAISLLGLAYCYLASTPITVMHAGRYGNGPVDRLSRFFWLGWVGVLAASLFPSNWMPLMIQMPSGILIFIFICAFILFLPKYSNAARRLWFGTRGARKFGTNSISSTPMVVDFASPGTAFAYSLLFSVSIISISILIQRSAGSDVSVENFRLIALGTPVLWIGIAQYFVLLRLWNEPDTYNKFYSDLFAARRRQGAQDVRDTYTHLREHSNAIFIVAVELSVLCLTLGLLQQAESTNSSSSRNLSGASFLLAAIGIWIVPTIFMWSRANAMERKFAESPNTFLPIEPLRPKEAKEPSSEADTPSLGQRSAP